MAAHNRDTYYPMVVKAVAKEVSINPSKCKYKKTCFET
jgi:hypothetical protein